ncbi:amidase signature domain-containing protein [Fusarium solani]|uniref:Amidase signature domain-containing protein n=1 Tax=Fusarium solani TaxID=169388 RepID=A0A9P9JUP4_FUSSL|nr:amidase signature domain-containing protein [Fusarium solani]KAH7227277.1 amidase signature domain-containing protein [Fusarium solani]
MAQFETNLAGGPNTQRALLVATAQDIQQLLGNSSLTSEALIDLSLRQIEQFDPKGAALQAMIKVAPREKLLAQARGLDQERQRGQVRGPLHGIPIILKDIFNTHPYWELPTTQGAKVLEHAENAGESRLVEQLTKAGLVVIGNANLPEFGAGKGEGGIGGLSALGGQARSAYVFEIVKKEDKHLANPNPGGSSTGSALAVAAGYCPISIGGEADGSLTTPASRAAMYALKCTPQTNSTDGIFQVVPTFETVGGMAKPVRDLANITNVILQAVKEPRSIQFKLPDFLFDSDEAYLAQVKGAIEKAINIIRQGGGPLIIPSISLILGRLSSKMTAEVRDSVNAYLAGLTDTPVRTLEEIIDWNKKHPELQAGIEQTYLIAAQNDTTTPEELAEARAFVKQASGPDALFKVMDELQLDAICAPTDGPICTLAAMAGKSSGRKKRYQAIF